MFDTIAIVRGHCLGRRPLGPVLGRERERREGLRRSRQRDRSLNLLERQASPDSTLQVKRADAFAHSRKQGDPDDLLVPRGQDFPAKVRRE